MPSAREGPSRPSPLGISERETSIPFASLGGVYLAHGQPRPSSRCAAPSLRCGPADSPPFCKSSSLRLNALATLGARLPRARSPAAVNPLARVLCSAPAPWVTAAADRAGMPLRASRKAGPQSTTAGCDTGAPLRCRGEPWNHQVHVPDCSLKDPPTHLVVPTRCGSKQTPSRSIAQATLSRRSATERRARACPWPRARSA